MVTGHALSWAGCLGGWWVGLVAGSGRPTGLLVGWLVGSLAICFFIGSDWYEKWLAGWLAGFVTEWVGLAGRLIAQ